MKILEKLNKIQIQLKVPKNQFNSFGKYYFRNCEDILESVKPLLDTYKCVLLLDDEVINCGQFNYIRSKATIIDIESGEEKSTTALAREAKEQKGMNDSQLTGSTSSYSRKYALSGLFDLDDTKDSDTTNKHDAPKSPESNNQKKETTEQTSAQKPIKTPNQEKKAENDECPECENGMVEIKTSKAGKKYWKCNSCACYGFNIFTESEKLDEEIPF